VVATLLAPEAIQGQVSFAGTPLVQLVSASQSNAAPNQVAVDTYGNLFFTSYNSVVQEIQAVNGVVPPNGNILNVMSGFGSTTAIAVDGAGDVFVADSSNGTVTEILAVNGSIPSSNPATRIFGSGLFTYPAGLAVDQSGNVYVADQVNGVVEEILAMNGSVPANATIVALGQGSLTAPTDVAVDSLGNLWVTDYGYYGADSSLKELLAVNGAVPASGATVFTLNGLNVAESVAVDQFGNVYFTQDGQTVYQVQALSGSTSFPSNAYQSLLFNTNYVPTGLAVDRAGHIYVADGQEIDEVQLGAPNFGGANVCGAGTGNPSPCSQTLSLNFFGYSVGSYKVLTEGAAGLDFQPQANDTNPQLCGPSYDADLCQVDVAFAPLAPGQRKGAVIVYDASGNVLATTPLVGTGLAPAVAFNQSPQATVSVGGLSAPGKTIPDESGNLYVADTGNGRVLKIGPTGTQTTVFSNSTSLPTGLAIDASGNLIIADYGNGEVVQLSPSGVQTVLQFNDLALPYGVATDLFGNIYVTDIIDNQVLQLAPTGFQAVLPFTGLVNPFGIAVDAIGDVYVADGLNSRIAEVSASGVQTNVPITGLDTPNDVAVDSAGDLFVVDNITSQAIEVTSSGLQTTLPVAGLANPTGVAVDQAGNLFIADSTNNRIVEFKRSQPPSLAFPATSIGSTSSSLSLQIQNVGSQPLAATSLTVSGNFKQVATSGKPADCKASGFNLAVGAECNITIDFTPQAAGNLTGSVVLSDNVLNAKATQKIGLKGTGKLLTQTISFTGLPATATFGAAGPYTLNATATSGLSVSYSVTGPGAVSGDILTITGAGTVVVTASQAGNSKYAPATPVSQTIVVKAGTKPVVSVSASLAFSTVAFGSTKALQLTVKNTGGANLTVSSISIVGQGYSAPLPACAASIAAGASCAVTVTFAPAFLGQSTGKLSLATNAGNPVVALTGNATGPQIAFSPAPQQTLGSGWGFPIGSAVDAKGNLYIADEDTAYVAELPAAGGAPINIGTGLNQADGVAVDQAGNIYISDLGNHRVVEVPASGAAQITLATGLTHPGGLAVDGSGNVYFADLFAPGVFRIPAGGGTPVALGSGWSNPFAIAVDAAGDVFVSDNNLNLIVELPAGGGPQVTILGSGLNYPSGLAVDAVGNLYVSDTLHSRVIELPANGGGQITLASSGLKYPYLLSVDNLGHIYIPDGGVHEVFELSPTSPPSLTFESTSVGSTSADSPQTVTVFNSGNTSLAIGGIGVPANFAQNTGSGSLPNCTSTSVVAAGASCTLSLSFTPKVAGSLSGNLVLTDNSLNTSGAKQSIPMSGTATQASQTIKFTPPASPAYVGDSPITLVAKGGASGNPVKFSIASGPGKLSGTNNDVLTITGTGKIVVAANQAGNSVYAPAAQVTQSITVLTPAAAVLRSPAPGSVLAGSSAIFEWSAATGPNVTGYALRLGSKMGAADLYDSSKITATSATPRNLPTNGMTVYAQLITYDGSIERSAIYLFKAARSPR
jgi:sugar lactone lactonase YvrE